MADLKNLSNQEAEGFVNLLKDDEPSILGLLADQMKSLSASSIEKIDSLAEKSNDEHLIDNWYFASSLCLKKKFEAWTKSSHDLEEGLMLLNQIFDPIINNESYTNILDTYAYRAREHLNPNSSHEDIFNSIQRVIFTEEGFNGNQLNYYDIHNNFLATVINNKTGNPITLSSILILVAKRLDLTINGIGAPGHFIVEINGKFYDPFFSAREVSKEECIMRAQELSVHWKDIYLEPVDSTFIIARSLRNLLAIYKKDQNQKKIDLISALIKLL